MPLNGSETHCRRGHEYTEENTGWNWNKERQKRYRYCKACRNRRVREQAARRRTGPAGVVGEKVGMFCLVCGRHLIKEHGVTEWCALGFSTTKGRVAA